MAKRTQHPEMPRRASLTPDQMRVGITKLERRASDLKTLDTQKISAGDDPIIVALQASIEQTLDSVFGRGTTDFNRYQRAFDLDHTIYHMAMGWPGGGGTTIQEIRKGVTDGVQNAIALLEQAARSLKEELEDAGESASGRALRAYDGMDLHPEISRAASALYRDGHYANAIEAAVKALNAFVRMRSGRDDLDGTTLMETVFTPKAPLLKFNGLSDQSDRDEQKGFMMMFSGAVAGLRNPRAHKLIKDDPERALEFIAFVSLLAKLLEGAST